MSLNSFIPTIWSARLLENLHLNLVYGSPAIINNDYEGEIRQRGDTVKINAIGTVNVQTYAKNTDINPPDELTDAQSLLTIDQQDYFNFQVDDIDRVQQFPQVMDAGMREAAYGLRNKVDKFIAALYVQASNTIGSDASPVTFSIATANYWNAAYENLVDMGVVLDENNVPAEGRWVVVPPYWEGMMLKDQRFVSYGTDANRAVLTNGLIGRAAGFQIYKSNNVPNTAGAKYKIIAGHNMAWTFANQITQVEAYRPQLRFADAVKGLNVYGAKVVRPNSLVVLTANKPA